MVLGETRKGRVEKMPQVEIQTLHCRTQGGMEIITHLGQFSLLAKLRDYLS